MNECLWNKINVSTGMRIVSIRLGVIRILEYVSAL